MYLWATLSPAIDVFVCKIKLSETTSFLCDSLDSILLCSMDLQDGAETIKNQYFRRWLEQSASLLRF